MYSACRAAKKARDDISTHPKFFPRQEEKTSPSYTGFYMIARRKGGQWVKPFGITSASWCCMLLPRAI